MALSRRLLLGARAAVAMTGSGTLVACSDGGSQDRGPASLPDGWGLETMEPLTTPVPAGMSPFTQETGSALFYWDRCWASDTSTVAGSDLVLARLWGPGAEDDVSSENGLAALKEVVGADVTLGDTDRTGSGERWLLTYTAGSGALWTVSNDRSQAVVVLFGPKVDESMVSSFDAGLVMTDEPDLSVHSDLWQCRQAEGVSVLVGRDWNDIGKPEARGGAVTWARAWTDRAEGSPLPGSVMVGDGPPGATLDETVAGFLQDPGITELREAQTHAFHTDTVEGQAVSFLWSKAGDFAGSVWFTREDDVTKAVLLLHWDASANHGRHRVVFENGIALL